MKSFDITIAFRMNTAPMGRPPVWQECERVERVFASSREQAVELGRKWFGARVIKCVCLSD